MGSDPEEIIKAIFAHLPTPRNEPLTVVQSGGAGPNGVTIAPTSGTSHNNQTETDMAAIDDGDEDDFDPNEVPWEELGYGDDTAAAVNAPLPIVQQAPAIAPVSPVTVTTVTPITPIQSVQQAAPPVVTPQVQPVKADAPASQFANDKELDSIESIMALIEQQINQLSYESGISLLADPNKRQPGNQIHDAIYQMRWESRNLINQTPQHLLGLEAVLTAHQVWVQSVQNRARAEFEIVGTELDNILNLKRQNYKGETQKEKEQLVISTEPRIAEFRKRYLVAKAMARFTEGLGERFAQLEDGLKRTISFVVAEYERQRIQQRFTA